MNPNPASFKLKGKLLKPVIRRQPVKEKVFTVVDYSAFSQTAPQSRIGHYLDLIKQKSNINYRIILPGVLGGFIIATFFSFSNFGIFQKHSSNKYSIYSSKPLTLVQSEQDVDSRDSRAQKINEIFKYYKCPLEGMGEVFVNEADKNDIPWWLVASIAFQESSCGKNTPKIDGSETYNAWGWGVYGSNIHAFDNWARGVEVISSYFKTRFFDQGITDTCDIMKIYTPPSNGSWCEGVNHFAYLIQNYKTP